MPLSAARLPLSFSSLFNDHYLYAFGLGSYRWLRLSAHAMLSRRFVCEKAFLSTGTSHRFARDV